MKYLIFCSVLYVCTYTVQLQSDNSNLLSVIVVYRHGDRTPTRFAPNDPYKNSVYFKGEKGELTNIGLQQQYELGKWLRKYYSKYLPDTYSREDLFVRSSSVDRCLMSAGANLAGLYPPVGNQQWNKTASDFLATLWRPIPIHSVPQEEDTVLEMATICPEYEREYDAILDEEYFQQIDKNNSAIYNYLQTHLGVPVTKFTDIEQWYDTMEIEDLYGLQLPDWTKGYYPDKMKPLVDLSFQISTWNERLSRFATGAFFEMIGSHLLAVVENSDENRLAKKMVIFSGHKTNIADITNALGTFRSAPYAGALIFELRNNTKTSKTYLNVLYRDGVDVERLKIEDCDLNCDLDKFLMIIAPLRVTDTQLEEDCKKNSSTKLTSFTLILVFAFVISTLNIF